MRYFFLISVLCCFSCNNARILQLPEIENAKVTEVLDVSPAYIFYDETQPDSTFLNRKNLISTTNWLVNVDKRLTLRQAMPHIVFLQDKKRNAEIHKNENAKNYFSCNDTSIKNLGFIEFTDVDYFFDSSYGNYKKTSELESDNTLIIEIKNISQILLIPAYSLSKSINTTIKDLSNDLLNITNTDTILGKKIKLILNISNEISFQDYISIKSNLLKLKSDKIIIDTKEFIY